MKNLCSNLSCFKILLDFVLCPVIRIVLCNEIIEAVSKVFPLHLSRKQTQHPEQLSLSETVENCQNFISSYEKVKIVT
jgi:hypothetical protein